MASKESIARWEAFRERYPDTDLLTPSDVAAIFAVRPKTVTRWADTGKLTYIRTLGGHRRYRRSEIDALLATRTDTRVYDQPDPSVL